MTNQQRWPHLSPESAVLMDALDAACDAAWGPVTEADMDTEREKQAAAARRWWGVLEPSAGRTGR